MEDIFSLERIKEYRKKNWYEAIEDFENKEKYICVKIKNISNNFEIPESEIFDIISECTDKKIKELFIAVRFSKNPKRQNIYENIIYDYLKENNRDEIKLPSRGPESVYLTFNGTSIGGPDHTDSIKSLDFYEEIRDKEIYYYHKYTEVEGGGQGNQYNDLKNFVRLAEKYSKNHQDIKIFVAVADGPYYRGAKLDTLARIAGEYIDRRIFIVQWHDLLDKINF